jgi:hypothetical protein
MTSWVTFRYLDETYQSLVLDDALAVARAGIIDPVISIKGHNVAWSDVVVLPFKSGNYCLPTFDSFHDVYRKWFEAVCQNLRAKKPLNKVLLKSLAVSMNLFNFWLSNPYQESKVYLYLLTYKPVTFLEDINILINLHLMKHLITETIDSKTISKLLDDECRIKYVFQHHQVQILVKKASKISGALVDFLEKDSSFNVFSILASHLIFEIGSSVDTWNQITSLIVKNNHREYFPFILQHHPEGRKYVIEICCLYNNSDLLQEAMKEYGVPNYSEKQHLFQIIGWDSSNKDKKEIERLLVEI